MSERGRGGPVGRGAPAADGAESQDTETRAAAPDTTPGAPEPAGGPDSPVGESGVPPTRSRRAALISGTGWQAVSQLAPMVVNLVLTPYIIAGLGLELYGVFLLVTALQVFMSTFDGGIGPSAGRYFALYAGRGDRVATTRLLVSLSGVVWVCALVVCGVAFAVAPQIVGFFPATHADPDGAVFLFRVLLITLAVAQWRSLFASVLWAQNSFVITSVSTLVGHVIYAVGLVVTIETGAGLVGIGWTLALQQVQVTLFFVPPALRYLTWAGVGFIGWRELVDFFAYSWKVQVSGMINAYGLQGDLMIVGKLAPASIGYFGPGATFAQQLRQVPYNAYVPIQSLVGRAVGELGAAGAVPDFVRVQRLWVIAVTGWIAVGAPAAYFGVTAWLDLGSTLPGVVASILLVGHLFWLLALTPLIWCLVLGQSGAQLRYGLISLVLNIALTIALIIPFGVVGTVVATAVAQLIATGYLVRVASRDLETTVPAPWGDIPWGATILAAVSSLVVVAAVDRLIGTTIPHGPVGLVACGLGAAPAAALYVWRTVGFSAARSLLTR